MTIGQTQAAGITLAGGAIVSSALAAAAYFVIQQGAVPVAISGVALPLITQVGQWAVVVSATVGFPVSTPALAAAIVLTTGIAMTLLAALVVYVAVGSPQDPKQQQQPYVDPNQQQYYYSQDSNQQQQPYVDPIHQQHQQPQQQYSQTSSGYDQQAADSWSTSHSTFFHSSAPALSPEESFKHDFNMWLLGYRTAMEGDSTEGYDFWRGQYAHQLRDLLLTHSTVTNAKALLHQVGITDVNGCLPDPSALQGFSV